MDKFKVESNVFDALEYLEKNYENPHKLLLRKCINGSEFNLNELKALNGKSFQFLTDCLDFGYELAQPEISENKILQEVSNLLEKQSHKGFEKYGEFVKADNLTIEEWIDHAREEIVDTLVYLTCIKHKLKGVGENASQD